MILCQCGESTVVMSLRRGCSVDDMDRRCYAMTSLLVRRGSSVVERDPEAQSAENYRPSMSPSTNVRDCHRGQGDRDSNDNRASTCEYIVSGMRSRESEVELEGQYTAPALAVCDSCRSPCRSPDTAHFARSPAALGCLNGQRIGQLSWGRGWAAE